MRFHLDAQPGRVWPAVAFGAPWNGWATPVVSRAVLTDLLLASGEPHRWDGEVAVLGTPADDLREDGEPEFWDRVDPGADGTYDLGQMGWTFVAETPLVYPGEGMRGPEFDYDEVRDLVPGGEGRGPLWVAWDTNALSLFETYGHLALELRFGEDGLAGGDVAQAIQSQHDGNQVLALLDLVVMWTGWDLRFIVLDATSDDAKRPPPPEVMARRSRSIEALSAALALGLDGEETTPALRKHPLPDSVTASLPRGKDTTLVEDAYRRGADVFLTMDKGILKRDQRIAWFGMRCLSPHDLRSRLIDAGLRRGFHLDYILGDAPDLARMSALLGAFESE